MIGMSYNYDNLAYDLSLFETPSSKSKTTRKPLGGEKNNSLKEISIYDTDSEKDFDNEEFDVTKMGTKPKEIVKRHPFKVLGYGVMLICTAAALIAMLCGQAQLTELNQKINEANLSLNEKESIYIQNEMKLEAELSPETVEYYASKVLGMTKLDNSKKEFIKLSEGDKAVIAEKNNTAFGEQIFEQFISLWE